MTEDQRQFISRMKQSIDEHIAQGNRGLAACLSKIVKFLPDCLSGAISTAIENDMDAYLIADLKQTFG